MSTEEAKGLVVAITHVDYTPADRTQYVIRVTDHQIHGVEMTVRRPYHEFRELRAKILAIMKPLAMDSANGRFLAAVEALSFPSKRLFGSRTESVVKTRAEALDKWLTKVLLCTHEYRKAQKRKSTHDASFNTQGSVLVLDALKEFLTTDIEEINRVPVPMAGDEPKVVPMPKRHSMPMESQRGGSSSMTNENERHTDNLPGYAPTLSPRSQWTKEKSNSASSVATTRHESSSSLASNSSLSSSLPPRSILKSNERPVSTRQTRAKTRFEDQPEPTPTKSSHRHRSSNRSSLSRSRDVNSSFLKDARYASTKPVVLKRIPSGNEAQIVGNAETELQSLGLTRDGALMLLRYLDKFLAKAMIRQPGCYRITPDNWLAIDAERLCLELEEAFFDPSEMTRVLLDGNTHEWRIPPKLEGYIQFKWTMDNHKKASEDSDDSDDSEVEIVSFRGKKKSRFSEHEIDEIEAMMSNGNASREQMKQLRRQLHEENWERYSRPGESAARGNDISDDEASDDEDVVTISKALPGSVSVSAAAAAFEDSDSDSDIGENEDFESFIQRKSQKLTGRLQGLV
ncbi:hypothetical protein SPRG_00346 [Saprolegnia parasitica CBS 223.65]|uniref:PX domain-containing protein n=1 Tax=Saprolegnia parasitica (strain CBS 223.65) TaxID=695850 RepID=A0A067CXR2_SAPPC|nr:hypothetical protein SPRG_00346 [Saprolegnia parasitica CBS 223.65]KDO35499.1 hypothetical protein SPRG_00346 [Saprolegnia parasitica CBS 223.65]|eukprot:XP_012193836.1 hypothetical protein SPRG_00346 [Saprolegnia parasitica CBS 223.65]